MKSLHDNTMRAATRTLFSLLFLLAWCFSPTTTVAGENQAEATTERFQKGEPFTLRAAMTTAFGNVRDDTSSVFRAELTADPNETFTTDYDGKMFVAKPASCREVESGGKHQFYLVTSAIPLNEEFRCHACSPLLSFFVFTNEDDCWKLTYERKQFRILGTYGEPPEIDLIHLGDNQPALLFSSSDIHLGYHDSYISLYIYNNTVARAFTTFTYQSYEYSSNDLDDSPETSYFNYTDVYIAPSNSKYGIIKTVTYGFERAAQSVDSDIVPVNLTQYLSYDESKCQFIVTHDDYGSLQFTLLASACRQEDLPAITVRNYFHALKEQDRDKLISLHTAERQQYIRKTGTIPLYEIPANNALRSIKPLSSGQTKYAIETISETRNKPLESYRSIFTIQEENGSWKISNISNQRGKTVGGCFISTRDYKQLKRTVQAIRSSILNAGRQLRMKYGQKSNDIIECSLATIANTETIYNRFTTDCRNNPVRFALWKLKEQSNSTILSVSTRSDLSQQEKDDFIRHIKQAQAFVQFICEQAAIIASN